MKPEILNVFDQSILHQMYLCILYVSGAVLNMIGITLCDSISPQSDKEGTFYTCGGQNVGGYHEMQGQVYP